MPSGRIVVDNDIWNPLPPRQDMSGPALEDHQEYILYMIQRDNEWGIKLRAAYQLYSEEVDGI